MNKLTILTVVASIAALTSIVSPSYAQFRQEEPSSLSTDEDCTALMGHMRSVSRADIDATSGGRVTLVPVCEDLTVAGKNNYGSLFIDGNADRLRLPIARNKTLMTALNSRAYDQHDVVSIRYGANNSVILYVHQRDMN